ncbi:MAG: DUF192 domain-containing protein [Cyanothece sp. SIO2G6]|nr:DUF192 domain-containing protein [Cyanothece sp. SIO2G6]
MVVLRRTLPLLIGLSLSVGLLGCAASSSLSSASDSVTSDSPTLVNGASSRPIQQASSLAQQLPVTAHTLIGDTQIDLEVAITPRQQAIGLMYRTELADNRGMLFPFAPPRPVNFWMRNVEINLDMIFIRDRQVIAIAAEVPPCRTDTCPTYGPVGIPVDAVLELRGGRAAELGLAVGDLVPITLLESPAETP